MIKTILILVENNFSQRDYERFGVDYFKQKGFDVEIFDLTYLINPELYQKNHLDSVQICYPQNFFQFFIEIYKKKHSHFIAHLGNGKIINHFIYATLFFCKIAYTKTKLAPHPYTGIILKTLIDKFFSAAKNPYKLILYFFSRLLPLDTPKYYLLAGTQTISKYLNTKVIHTGSMDYQLFSRYSQFPPQQKHIVFLDEFEPFHPDYKRSKEPNPISPEKYYPLLSSFFLKIELIYGQKVIIAAHPRADETLYKFFFNNRCIKKGITAELVRDASLVLAHSSTAISFAVLWKKPIILLTLDSFEKIYQGPLMNYIQKTLDLTKVNIVKEVPTEIPVPNVEKYSEYINRFILSDRAKVYSPWEALIQTWESQD